MKRLILALLLLAGSVQADSTAMLDMTLPVAQSADSLRFIIWNISDTDVLDTVVFQYGMVPLGGGDYFGTVAMWPDSANAVPTGAAMFWYKEWDRGDVDRDGKVNVADLTKLVQILFYGDTE